MASVAPAVPETPSANKGSQISSSETVASAVDFDGLQLLNNSRGVGDCFC